jgi:hypothetical protein
MSGARFTPTQNSRKNYSCAYRAIKLLFLRGVGVGIAKWKTKDSAPNDSQNPLTSDLDYRHKKFRDKRDKASNMNHFQ